MTYAILNSGQPIASPASLGKAIRTIWIMWWINVRGRTDWMVLLTLFVGLEIADIVTTNFALTRPDTWEANPLMALAQAHLGTFWWLPKAVAVCFVCLGAPFTRRRWFMIIVTGYCALTVAGNLLAP